ncbi:hypothetical protein LINPERPRIM_LOCUS27788 [Linum perenne]
MMVQVSTRQRERLAMFVDKLNQSSDRLHESRRTVLETEELSCGCAPGLMSILLFLAGSDSSFSSYFSSASRSLTALSSWTSYYDLRRGRRHHVEELVVGFQLPIPSDFPSFYSLGCTQQLEILFILVLLFIIVDAPPLPIQRGGWVQS